MKQLFLLCFLTLWALSTNAQNADDMIHLDGSKGKDRFIISLSEGSNVISISGLSVGHTYYMSWIFDHELSDILVPYGSERSFRARNTTYQVVVQTAHAQDGYLSFARHGLSSSSEPNWERSLNAITHEEGFTADELVRDVLIGGNCFDVENVTGIGTMNIGRFSNGMASIGMDEGVFICTGSPDVMDGPNLTSDAGDWVDFEPMTDPDLSMTSSFELYDISGIEFEFSPKTDTIQFRYVFASEEYCEFVMSEFNDRFGFFISGPGINGPFSDNAINIALIPNTGANVAINSVNSVTNSTYYVDNVPVDQVQFGDFDCEEDLMNPGVAEEFIQYDGFTVVLTARVVLVPCEVYKIRLVLADQSDGAFDSGVFLEANSFGNDDLVISSLVYPDTSLGFAAEDCGESGITFTRQSMEDMSQDLFINYTIDTNSTATSAEDYLPLPSQIVIPAGQASVFVPVEVFSDDIIEGSEFIHFLIDNSCTCSEDVLSFEIRDYQPMLLSPENVSLCQPQERLLTVPVQGGLEPYSYSWSTGEVTDTILAFIEASDTFDVTVTDVCGQMVDTSIIISSGFEVMLDISQASCEDTTSASVTINTSGGTPPFTYTWSDGVMNMMNTRQLDLGSYMVTISDESGCELVESFTVDGSNLDYELNIPCLDAMCLGMHDGRPMFSFDIEETNDINPDWRVIASSIELFDGDIVLNNFASNSAYLLDADGVIFVDDPSLIQNGRFYLDGQMLISDGNSSCLTSIRLIIHCNQAMACLRDELHCDDMEVAVNSSEAIYQDYPYHDEKVIRTLNINIPVIYLTTNDCDVNRWTVTPWSPMLLNPDAAHINQRQFSQYDTLPFFDTLNMDVNLLVDYAHEEDPELSLLIMNNCGQACYLEIDSNILPKNEYMAQKRSATSSIEQHLKDLSVFPNPANEMLFIERDHSGRGTLSLINMNGQTVHQTQIPKESLSMQLGIGGIPAGVYALKYDLHDIPQQTVRVVIY